MDSLDFVFTEEQYKQLQDEYRKTLTPAPQAFINELNSIINTLQHTSFQMPLWLQNQILRNLSTSRQSLSLLWSDKILTKTRLPIHNSPWSLISILIQLSKELTNQSLKTPYQILLLKSNAQILQSIEQICAYFLNKKF